MGMGCDIINVMEKRLGLENIITKKTSKILFVIVAFVWGVSFSFQKVLLENIGPAVFNFYNFAVPTLILLIMAIWNKNNILYKWRYGAVLGIYLSGLEIFQMYGLKYSTAANTVFLSNMGMLIIPFVAFLLYRNNIKKENIIALILSIIGMYLLVGGLDKFNFGEGLLLISSIFMSLYFLYSHRFGYIEKGSVTVICFQSFFVSTIILFFSAIFLGEQFTIKNDLVFDLIWQIIVFTLLPYFLVQIASIRSDHSNPAIYDGILEPLVGAIVAWVIFKESVSYVNVMGAFIMVFSFIFAVIYSMRHFYFNKYRKE